MQSMSLHAVMSDSSVHLQLCLDIKDFHCKDGGFNLSWHSICWSSSYGG